MLPTHTSEYKNAICQQSPSLHCRCSQIESKVTFLRNYADLIEPYKHQETVPEASKYTNINLVVKDVDISYEPDERGRRFWYHIGDSVKVLKINITGTHFDVLFDILVRCPNLECLTVITDSVKVNNKIYYAFFDQLRFRKLLHFDVSGHHDLIIPLTRSVTRRAPLLQYLTFKCGPRRCPCQENLLHIPIAIVFNFKRTQSLRAVDIQCSSVSDKFISNMIRSELKLESLCIFDSKRLTEFSLITISNNYKQLKRIMIGNWSSSVYFINIFTTFSELTVVSLFSSDFLNDYDVTALIVLKHLTHLNISHCKKVTDAGISGLLGVRPRFLVELRLVKLLITDKLIKIIAPCLPILEFLNLSHCHLITKASIAAIANHNLKLKCLLLNGCKKLNLEAEQGLEFLSSINRMKKLVHFSAEGMIPSSHTGLVLPLLRVLDCTVHPSSIANLKYQFSSLIYIHNFCYQTNTFQEDGAMLFLKRTSILECYKSPLNYCSYKWQL